MASKIEIINMAMTLLGEARILSIDDDVKPAREAKAIYDITRDAVLAADNWSFAITRSQLSALSTAPAFEYGVQYQMPSEALRMVFIGDRYVGADLTDYRSAPVEEFTIEGRVILTDLAAPLNVRFVQRVEDTTQFNSTFTYAFAAKLASVLAEPLTQSSSKRRDAEDEYQKARSMAVRANAIELPPQKLADDEWVLSRL
jgi:hypothetical protein